ncbi:MAG: acyl-CoA dehydrogenase family protein, partial [Desulfobulbaceae bacterium]|nr:acyl-CoA dehydrogenase family protein [Desulfobulbaceae bacterium]
QRQVQDMLHRFADNELRPIARDCDEEEKLPTDLLEKFWALGFCSNIIPEKYGGYGMGRSAVTAAIMCEELAWGDASLSIGALSPLLLAIPVLEFGTEEQKENWLPKFCGEKFYAATGALMERRITFEPAVLNTTVEIGSDSVVINGAKCNVPLADQAEQILVYATTAKGGGVSAIEAVIVDRNTPGVIVGEREKNMGFNPLPLFTVTFDNVEVPKSRRLGGDSGIDYMRLMNLSRANLCAMAVGVSRASNEYAIKYAKERYAFGEPIASRQSVAWMLGESAMEVAGMRLMVWRTAWLLDHNEDATREASLTKMYCADKTMLITDYGVQILGGHGYIREYPVELWFRNGRGFDTMEGIALG